MRSMGHFKIVFVVDTGILTSEKMIIGVDCGTESLRAGVFDVNGKPLAMATASYPTSFPEPAWAEQNPTDWWQVSP